MIFHFVNKYCVIMQRSDYGLYVFEQLSTFR